jgi:hypothetical protein
MHAWRAAVAPLLGAVAALLLLVVGVFCTGLGGVSAVLGGKAGRAKAAVAAKKAAKRAPPDLVGLYVDWLRVSSLFRRLRSVAPGCPKLRTLLEVWLLQRQTPEEREAGAGTLSSQIEQACSRKTPPQAVAGVLAAIAWDDTERQKERLKPRPALEVSPGEIRYGEYRLRRSPRIDRLLEIGGASATLASHLAYSGILAGAHQWGIPVEVFDVLWAAGVRNEAFASPFNANVLELGAPAKTGAAFFSLFPELDAPFGSRGDFFAARPEELLRLKGGWAINPPFTMKCLSEAAARAAMLAAKRRVFFVTRLADPARLSPYAAISDIAAASRVLEENEHSYAVLGPTGGTRRRGRFQTHLLLAGPEPPAEQQDLMNALVAAWRDSEPEGVAAFGGDSESDPD